VAGEVGLPRCCLIGCLCDGRGGAGEAEASVLQALWQQRMCGVALLRIVRHPGFIKGLIDSRACVAGEGERQGGRQGC
jgi:hypothetical protein